MGGECRFDPRVIDVPRIPNETQSFQYACEKCHLWHWVIPEFELDGTAVTSRMAREDIEDALERYYQNAHGISWRAAVASGESTYKEVPDWQPVGGDTDGG